MNFFFLQKFENRFERNTFHVINTFIQILIIICWLKTIFTNNSAPKVHEKLKKIYKEKKESLENKKASDCVYCQTLKVGKINHCSIC